MNLQRALEDPASCFAHPADVVLEPSLSLERKIEILHRWEYDARLLEVAQEENMTGDEPSVLSEVLDALHALGSHGRGATPTQEGSENSH